jgi:cytochrome c-type biogenesis protein CcsB|uniref:Cytochrome c biogenesis protein CcsA n=1 Tax=Attheya longicornis TaxID=451786 RepID=A0A2U9NQD3_9STRA|nr:cytochrome c heme attachment protein [Attheya longicornis]AWT39136.1 cytochrome c heme attachment protein [Attheya longicornis]
MDWNLIQNFSSNIVFGILLFSMTMYWINLSFFKGGNNLAKIGKFSAIIANILLFFILCSRWIIAGYFPLSNLYESLLFLTWTLLTIYLYIEYKTQSKVMGAILIPVALLINGFANLTLSAEMQKSSPLVPALQSNWLMMHVSMMMLSYATLIMGSLLCILFLVISKYKEVDLKIIDESSLPLYNIMLDYYEAKLFVSPNENNRETVDEISELGKLKLLQSLDNWSYRIIGLGFPFLTIGIIAGGVWANEAWGSYWSWDPKETWALITWIVFATYLHSRITKGWEGKKTAILGSLGFFVIWVCYLGVNFLGKGLHSYGWLS